MSRQSLVSTVIATYNMGNFLGDSIRSVLSQTYDNLEVIVVDDGSTDDTQQVVEMFLADPRVRYQHQQNGGQRAAKNAGIRAARGEYVAFNDADDLWYPQKLEKQIPLFADDGKIGVVYSERDLIDQNGRPTSGRKVQRYRGSKLCGKMLINNFVPFSTAVIARRCIEELGVFDEQLEGSIDYDLWLRYLVYYEFDFIPEPLAAHRVWSGQMSQGKKRRYEAAMYIQERFLREHPGLVTRRDVRLARAMKYTGRGRWHAREKRRREACGDFLRAMANCPTYWMAYKTFAKMLLGIG